MDAVRPSNKFNFNLDLRLIIIVLITIIVAMLAIWRPWASGGGGDDQVVEVTGEATVKATPDEFVFYPNYQFKQSDREAALSALSKKSAEIVAKLKELGVPESGIKTNSSGHDYPLYPETQNDETTYTLQLTVTVNSQDLAQKAQNYLITTKPLGAVSPQPSFSENTRKQLESQARDIATQDARAKADQMARNLGFKIGRIKSISDGQGFGVMPFEGRGVAIDDAAKPAMLTIQPGENELSYSVRVTYFIR